MINASFGYILTRGHGKLHLPQPITNFLKFNVNLLSVVAGIATNKARKNIQKTSTTECMSV